MNECRQPLKDFAVPTADESCPRLVRAVRARARCPPDVPGPRVALFSAAAAAAAAPTMNGAIIAETPFLYVPKGKR